MILLPATLLDEALTIAERLRAVMEKSTLTEAPQPLKLTFSAGVACSTEHQEVEQLCRIADRALYLAKQTRNRVVSQEAIAVPVKENNLTMDRFETNG